MSGQGGPAGSEGEAQSEGGSDLQIYINNIYTSRGREQLEATGTRSRLPRLKGLETAEGHRQPVGASPCPYQGHAIAGPGVSACLLHCALANPLHQFQLHQRGAVPWPKLFVAAQH